MGSHCSTADYYGVLRAYVGATPWSCWGSHCGHASLAWASRHEQVFAPYLLPGAALSGVGTPDSSAGPLEVVGSGPRPRRPPQPYALVGGERVASTRQSLCMATVASPKQAGDRASKRGDKAYGHAVWLCGRVVATLAVAAFTATAAPGVVSCRICFISRSGLAPHRGHLSLHSGTASYTIATSAAGSPSHCSSCLCACCRIALSALR